MNAVELEPMVASSSLTSTPCDGVVPTEVASGKARGIRQVCRQLFGIPDYDRYLAHASTHHPGAPVLSRREFCAQAIERKYGKNGPRCC